MMNGHRMKTTASDWECRKITMNTEVTKVTTKTKACNPISPIGTMLDYSTDNCRGKTDAV